MFAGQMEQVLLPGRVDDVTLLVLLWVKKHDNATETHRSKNIKNPNRVETNYNYFVSVYVKKRQRKRTPGNININCCCFRSLSFLSSSSNPFKKSQIHHESWMKIKDQKRGKVQDF